MSNGLRSLYFSVCSFRASFSLFLMTVCACNVWERKFKTYYRNSSWLSGENNAHTFCFMSECLSDEISGSSSRRCAKVAAVIKFLILNDEIIAWRSAKKRCPGCKAQWVKYAQSSTCRTGSLLPISVMASFMRIAVIYSRAMSSNSIISLVSDRVAVTTRGIPCMIVLNASRLSLKLPEVKCL